MIIIVVGNFVIIAIIFIIMFILLNMIGKVAIIRIVIMLIIICFAKGLSLSLSLLMVDKILKTSIT